MKNNPPGAERIRESQGDAHDFMRFYVFPFFLFIRQDLLHLTGYLFFIFITFRKKVMKNNLPAVKKSYYFVCM